MSEMESLERENKRLRGDVAALEELVTKLRENDRLNKEIEDCLLEACELLAEDEETKISNNEAHIRSLEANLRDLQGKLLDKRQW